MKMFRKHISRPPIPVMEWGGDKGGGSGITLKRIFVPRTKVIMLIAVLLLSVIGGGGGSDLVVGGGESDSSNSIDLVGGGGGGSSVASNELIEDEDDDTVVTGDLFLGEGASSTTTVDPLNPHLGNDVLSSSTSATNNNLNFNVNLTNVNLDDLVRIGTDTSFLKFLFSLLLAFLWVLYITFYSSRIIGLVVTKVVNRFIKEGHIKIGSISVSILSGKVMFRDVAYVTEDCSLRIQDGWVIFRWWRAYVPKDISEDMSHSDTRLSILLNGFEYHLYNRSEMYSRLEKLFGLESVIFPGHSKSASNASNQTNNNMSMENSGTTKDPDSFAAAAAIKSQTKKPPSSGVGYSWRDLIPVIKLELCCGRVVFGNMLVPYTLALVVEEAHLIYTTKPAASRLDRFMHIVKCRAENFKVVLSQSPKYTGLKDEPPRLMGEGFGIVTSNKVEFYYYMDEPGIVPSEPEMLQLANGDLVEANPPMWGIDIKCDKGTDFSYGPWADRQREQLYKLFYPQDYQPMKPTPAPLPGEQRQIQSFDIRLSTLNVATIDILFSKDQETNAVHMNIGPGSYLEVTIPWLVQSDGYTTKITGQLLHLEASTSLQYRNFVESETLQFTIRSHYPIHWNDHQEWKLELTGCKASVNLIFAHKWFFQAMVNDWSSRTPPDILHFVPYTWKINFCLKEFEIITAVNEYNWIDCSSQHHENNLLAACGELFELSFDLPFHEFLPETVLFKFWIQIEGGDLNFYVPRVSTAYVAVQSLGKTAKIRNPDGSVHFLNDLHSEREDETNNTAGSGAGGTNRRSGKVKKWRNVCQHSSNWIECWSVPICAISISFTYHPMPPLGPTPQADVTTPEKEESLLSPIRIPGDREHSKKHLKSGASLVYSDFDPLSLPSDHVHVELEVGPSVLLLYGSLLKLIINLKENIFGDHQEFIDMERIRCGASYLFTGKTDKSSHLHTQQMESSILTSPGQSSLQSPSPADKIDFREYRPLDVTVSAILHDIRGHLLKNCNEDDPPCPTICVERFGFEMNKKYRETMLQVLLSPIMMLTSDTVERFDSGDKHLGEGYLMLSGLQVRGHAMFSNDGRSLDQETLEYAWLIEVQLGRLSGRLSAPHLENIVSGVECFVLNVLDEENTLRSPHSFLQCHHGNNQFECEDQFMEQCPTTTSTTQGGGASTCSTLSCSQCGGVGGGENSQCSQCGATGTGTPQAPPTTSSSSGSFPTATTTGAVPSHQTNHKVPNGLCPTSEEIKYKMVRLSVDAVDVYLVEGGTALSLWISPIRLALCNLHGHVMREGFTLLIPNLQLRHFVMVNPAFTKRFQFSDLNIIQSSSETMTASWTAHGQPQTQSPTQASPTSTSGQSWSYLWLEAGAVALGPLCVEMAVKGNGPLEGSTQLRFLNRHDKKTRRLWFLWGASTKGEGGSSLPVSTKRCACAGGCAFFGSNAGGSRFFWPSKKDWMDGVNVACFRVNKPGEDAGFGQSILKSGVLVFDTPPYTTQGTSLIEMPSEWGRGGGASHSATKPTGTSSKAPFTFKPSLLADLSHTSSSASPHNERYYNTSSTSGTGTISTRRKLSTQSIERSRGTLERKSESSRLLTSTERESRHGTPTCQLDYFHSFDDDSSKVDLPGQQDAPTVPPSAASTLLRLNSLEERQSVLDETLSNRLRHKSSRQWDGSYDSLDSLSDVSFISALSVQEECMVNLQMHLNKPITESSLLMPCYMSHLTQLKCDNWHVSAPNCTPSDSLGLAPFVQMQDGKLIYAGSKYTPCFEPLVDGFTTLAMVDRGGVGGTPPSSASCVNTPSQTHFWETPIYGGVSGASGGVPNSGSTARNKDQFQHYTGTAASSAAPMENDEFYRTILSGGDGEEEGGSPTSSECTTLVVRTKNDVNIMVSPMLLEALQKFVEAITPTLCSLHPLSVVNHLHSECISRVEKANLLKKEKSIFLMRMQNSKRNTAIRQEQELSPVHKNLFEQVLQTAIQGSISIPKMNLTLLQASVVEEVISFSALDNIRDLMCVSMLAVAIERTHIYFLYREQERKTVQVLHRPAILPKAVKKRKNKVSTSESILSEPVFIENSEKQSELISTSIDITRLHAQLRRLKNDSSILKEAVITAIPNPHSKVLFRFAKIPCSLAPNTGHGTTGDHSQQRQETTLDDPSEMMSENGTFSHQQRPISSDEKLGFIMCECGLEGISLKGVKNSEAQTKEEKLEEDEKLEEETVSVTLCNEVAGGMATSSSSAVVPPPPPSSSTADAASMAGKDKDIDLNSDKETNTLVEDHDDLAGDEAASSGTGVVVKGKSSGNGGDAASASCVIRFKVMWYNFAAPPQTPITRKIDYTRVDWNLVSTASTAINAWLNPIDQLTIGIVAMLRGYSRRTTGLLASLMAEALDSQSIHQPTKSKYNKLTPMAKTLQEDPSCQLCIVLRRYISETDMDKIEGNVKEPRLPQLSTLRQGVIVLSRQWKNVLYTPLLLEHNLKSKKSKNFTVTFTLPHSEEESPGSDGEMSVGEETTDERATLLDMEGGTVSSQSFRFDKSSGRNFSSSSMSDISGGPIEGKRKQLPENRLRASDVYSLPDQNALNNMAIVGDNGRSQGASNFTKDNSKRSSATSSIWSHVDGESERLMGAESGRSTPGANAGNHKRLNRSDIIRQVNEWNQANQNESGRSGDGPHGKKDADNEEETTSRGGGNTHMGNKSNKRYFSSEQSHEESLLLGAHSKFPQHPSLMLLDAHVIFKPLLTSMGLMPHQIMGYSFDHLGSHMSIKAAIDMLRIDIVESEIKGIGKRVPPGEKMDMKGQQSSAGTSSSSSSSPFVLNIAPEVPAFLCEKIGLEGDFQKSADVNRDMLNRRNMIYVSRNYWKKQAKSAIIFSVNIDYISQQVNMPLLRLLHQITTMYQNVRETQMELREQRPAGMKDGERIGTAGAPQTTILCRSSSGRGVRHKNSSSSDGGEALMGGGDKAGSVIIGGGVGGGSSILNRQPSQKSTGGYLQAPSSTATNTLSSALATRTHSFAQRFKKGSSVLHHKLNFEGNIRNSSASQTPTSLRAPTDLMDGTATSSTVVGGGVTIHVTPSTTAGGAPSAGTPAAEQMTAVATPPAPNCWRTIYYLLDLYATRPETKTVINNKPLGPPGPQLSSSSFNKGQPRVSGGVVDGKDGGGKDVLDEAEKGHPQQTSQEQIPQTSYATSSLEKQRDHLVAFETPRVSIFGIARIQRTRLLASLSGLKLEAEIMNLQASSSYKKKLRPAAVELSLTGHVGQSMIVLLEGVAPNQQTVVRVSVSKSGALYSSISRRMKDKNSGLLTVGPVIIDIPQHPVVLHGMMTRSTKQLSNTLQEFRVNRTASRISRGTTFDEVDFAAHLSHQVDSAMYGHGHHHHHNTQQPHTGEKGTAAQRKASDSTFFQPLQMQFTIVLQSLSITAALLPSLQAQYKMEQVKSCGITGSKAKFQIRLPIHSLSFTTKLSMANEASTLPSAASISLPQVDVTAEYIHEEHGAGGKEHDPTQMTTDEGVVLRTGSYLSAFADIGAFEHCLTTDLLNHLVFVQKVFMKEVNEVVLKMSGGDKPVPLWEDDGTSRGAVRSLLFALVVRLQSIQITATTPTNTAVRLETGLLEFQMSNRVKTDEDEEGQGGQWGEGEDAQPQQTSSWSRGDRKKGHGHGHHGHGHGHHSHKHHSGAGHQTGGHHGGVPQFTDVNKVFIKAQVDVNLSLGQLIRNMVFEEADSEYQQYAFFKTRIGLRNVADMGSTSATSTMLGGAEGQDKEVVLITLTRPLIYVQPIAVDKAILVWLNYKSAYEYWNEQRSSLNTEVMTCTGITHQQQQPLPEVPQHQHRLQPQQPPQPPTPQHHQQQQQQQQQHQPPQGPPVLQSSTLFLQLTVDDMGISIPLNPSPHGLRADSESRGAVVVTLESTSISACSSGSLVSKGRFTGLCFRFTDDMVSMDDWKPNPHDPSVMNFCQVSEGTYEVCSRTTSRKSGLLAPEETGQNAKWFLNVQWQMEGVDMHVDVNIGKQLSALGHTLTTLAAFEEDEDEDEDNVVGEDDEEREEDLDEDGEGRDDFVNSDDFPESALVGEEVVLRRPTRAARSISQESVVLLRRQKSTQAQENKLPAFLTDPSVGPRQKRSMLEKEMQERISLIDELNKAGSPQSQIEDERRKLQELENVAFRDFRRDWIKKLRRQSTKAAGIRDKFSWSGGRGESQGHPKTLGHRSKSLAVSTPDSDKQPDWSTGDTGSFTPTHSFAAPSPASSRSSLLLNQSQLRATKQRVTFGNTWRQYSVDSGSITTPDDEDEFVGVWLDNDSQDMADEGDGHAPSMGGNKAGGHMTPGSSVSHTKAQEPNVDLELDVKVFINSGKCVLHTKAKEDDDILGRRRKRSERSGSGYDSLLHISSPIMSRKARHNVSTNRIKSPFAVGAGGVSLTDVTTFHIPGLDVKIHYDSHTLYEERENWGTSGMGLPTGMMGSFSGNGQTSGIPSGGSLGGLGSSGGRQYTHERSDSGSSTGQSGGFMFSNSRRSGTKRASMFAWITLHSVPEETIISPHILDFLEQTLEPIPLSVLQQSKQNSTSSATPGPPPPPASQQQSEGVSSSQDTHARVSAEDEEDAVTSTYYASFPVDVIVYFHMQPSTFRFSCQPVSRVECMLRLPALDIVFSSKRAEEEYDYEALSSAPGGVGGSKGKHHHYQGHHLHHHIHHPSFSGSTSSASFRNKLRTTSSSADMGPMFSGSGEPAFKQSTGSRDSQSFGPATPVPSSSIIGGLSVTGCLSDFSLYIFHPYGAAKKTDQWSPLSDNERKDSVSMNVEFVKFHLSRSRKVHLMSSGNNTFIFMDQGNTSSSSNNTGSGSRSSHQAAIRFSTIVDIGSASFKYDMRRLTEILAFPKAWYRRSLVRRVFLGDMSTTPLLGDDVKDGSTSSPSLPQKASSSRRNSFSYGGKTIPESGSTGRKRSNIMTGSLTRSGLPVGDMPPMGSSSSSGPPIPSWETLVLFTVNFTKLNVQMNMGNVMGNVSWLIRDAKSEGRLSIGSTGHKNLYIGVGLNSSYIEAKGGIVAGTFELTQLNTYVRAQEDPGVEPHHTVGLKMYGLELRLDFMGTSVLMGRVSGLEVKLKDEWQVQSQRGRHYDSEDSVLATYRPAMIFIHGDMGWDQLQLMISKSTTVDLLKMHCKLDEFFSQQFKSSKWVLSSMHHDPSAGSGGGASGTGNQLTPNMARKAVSSRDEPAKVYFQHQHHRHWQQVLDKVSLMSISSMMVPLPEAGTVLGGTMDLHGNNISLACFHGVNFKAKSWALFSLKEPLISFSTEAQETRQPETSSKPHGVSPSPSSSAASTCCVHVVQNLNFSLGQQNTHAMSINSVQHESMAMVCRITRNVMFPPQFRTLHEWFHYAFAPSEIDDVARFPSLERERERMERERADSGGSERRTPARLHDPNHNREVIFALPSLELFFKTEHLQACTTPDAAGPSSTTTSVGKPVVECSFITEFGDHIFVTVDAEAFFFLHDLITSYIKEKEKLVSAQLAAGRSQSPSVRLDAGEVESNYASASTTPAGGSSPMTSRGPGSLGGSISNSNTPGVSSSNLSSSDTTHLSTSLGPSSQRGGLGGSSSSQKQEGSPSLHPLSGSTPLQINITSSSPSRSPSGPSTGPTLELEMRLQRDWRDYHCKTWQLEPTVRLLSWAGKSIEPYGVDYILQKLGFSHARITIPKWMQRGFCDPLDKVLSVLIFRMVDLARREGSTSRNTTTTSTDGHHHHHS